MGKSQICKMLGGMHSKHWEQVQRPKSKKRLQLFEEQKRDTCEWNIVSKQENGVQIGELNKGQVIQRFVKSSISVNR